MPARPDTSCPVCGEAARSVCHCPRRCCQCDGCGLWWHRCTADGSVVHGKAPHRADWHACTCRAAPPNGQARGVNG